MVRVMRRGSLPLPSWPGLAETSVDGRHFYGQVVKLSCKVSATTLHLSAMVRSAWVVFNMQLRNGVKGLKASDHKWETWKDPPHAKGASQQAHLESPVGAQVVLKIRVRPHSYRTHGSTLAMKRWYTRLSFYPRNR